MTPIRRIAPLSGLAFAVLFGVGSGLWAFDQPSRGAGTGEILEFFENASTPILVGGTLSVGSLVFLVWFGAVLRERLDAADDSGGSGLPLVAFAGALLLGAVGLGAETINMAAALSAKDGQLTGEAAQIYFDLTYAFGAHGAGIAIAVMVLPVGITVLRTGRVLPLWAGWLAVVLGVVLLTPAMLNRTAFLVLYASAVVLAGVLSVHLYRTQYGRPA